MKNSILPLFDLHHDQADFQTIEQTIRQGVQIGGTNLWVLIFAILIASIGLNVNSTAVIIGAMLISPLMGPIIAIGFGVATGDAGLIRTALRNLGTFVLISLISSFLYFKLSPLSLAHSELLARTTPTLWDVLIAFFGGSAGIIALTRRYPSPVLPGVAIATALMPPLCTAGYGLATGNWGFFGGAFYLFAINSVFIALATALFVKLMKIPEHHHATPALHSRTRLWISVLLVAMLVPSTWLGYRLVKEELFIKAANQVLGRLDEGRDYFELSRRIDAKAQSLMLTIGGGQPPAELPDRLRKDMGAAGFPDATVAVRYLGTANLSGGPDQQIEAMYAKSLTQLETSNRLLKALSVENRQLKEGAPAGLEQEILAQYPQVDSVAILAGTRSGRLAPAAELTTITLFMPGMLPHADLERLKAWLSARFSGREVVVLTAPLPPQPVSAMEKS